MNGSSCAPLPAINSRQLVLRVGRHLEANQGRRRHYSTQEVSHACTACGYGWELYRYAHAFYCRTADFHNLYGPGRTQHPQNRNSVLTEMLNSSPDVLGTVAMEGAEATAQAVQRAKDHIQEQGNWNWD
jgi:hypothetical protein